MRAVFTAKAQPATYPSDCGKPSPLQSPVRIRLLVSKLATDTSLHNHQINKRTLEERKSQKAIQLQVKFVSATA